MQVDFPYTPTIRREPYLEYEFVADIGSGAKVLFNDPTLSYNHLVALETSNKLLRFRLLDAEPTMTIPGEDYLIYPSVMPQVDLAYELYPGRLKEVLVINSPSAKHEFTFALETEGVTACLQDDDTIAYKDADGNNVWNIDAPYATDTNGAAVKTSFNFDGSTYTISAIPDSSTAYPIKLDPTVSFASYYVWNYDSVVSSATMPTYQMGLAAADNSLLVTSLTVYCRRKFKTSYYYSNTNTSTTVYFQFYDSNNQPMGDKADLVVSSLNETATISVPVGAYRIDFTGSIVNTMAEAASNILRIVSVETSASKLDIAPQSLTNTSSSKMFKLDDSTFNSNSNGTTVTKTIEAPVDSTFKAGTYTVTCSRTMYGYHNATAYLYKTDGTLYSSTKISYPSAPSGGAPYSYKTTSLVVPEGIAQITVTGTRIAGTIAYTDSNITFGITLKTPDYGTAKYTLTLTEDANGLSIVPAFTPCRPANQYKTYVCYGSDVFANYSESKTITATSGTVVYVKVVLSADESANTTACSPLYLANIASTEIGVMVALDTTRGIINQVLVRADLSRGTAVLEDTVVETKRKITATEEAAAESLRFLVATAQVPVDINRTVIVANTIATDTKRRISRNTLAILSDTKRRLIKPLSNQFDTKRSISNTSDNSLPFDTKRITVTSNSLDFDLKRRINAATTTSYDSRRSTKTVEQVIADTKRVLTNISIVNIAIDTLREIVADISIQADLKRRTAAPNTFSLDSRRVIRVPVAIAIDTTRVMTKDIIVPTDTQRRISLSQDNKFDLARTTVATAYILLDTKRKIPIIYGDGDVECIDVIIPVSYEEIIACISAGEIGAIIILP